MDYVSGTLGAGRHHPGLRLSPGSCLVVNGELSSEGGAAAGLTEQHPLQRDLGVLASLVSLPWDWKDEVALHPET